MDVRFITKGGIEERGVEELPLLLQGEDGLVWADIPAMDDEGARVLSDVFRFHPLAVKDATERNRVPKMHAYHDHVFVILHAPERGKHGHVHYVELDQFIGRALSGDGAWTRQSGRPPRRCPAGDPRGA